MVDKITSWVLNANQFMTHNTEEVSALELVGKTADKTNELVVFVNQMLEEGIIDPLTERLQILADNGDLGRLIQELIIIDGGVF